MGEYIREKNQKHRKRGRESDDVAIGVTAIANIFEHLREKHTINVIEVDGY